MKIRPTLINSLTNSPRLLYAPLGGEPPDFFTVPLGGGYVTTVDTSNVPILPVGIGMSSLLASFDTTLDQQSWILFNEPISSAEMDFTIIKWAVFVGSTITHMKASARVTLLTDTPSWNPYTLSYSSRPAISSNDLLNNTASLDFDLPATVTGLAALVGAPTFLASTSPKSRSIFDMSKIPSPVIGAVAYTSVVTLGTGEITGSIRLIYKTKNPANAYPVIARESDGVTNTFYLSDVTDFVPKYPGPDSYGNMAFIGFTVRGVNPIPTPIPYTSIYDYSYASSSTVVSVGDATLVTNSPTGFVEAKTPCSGNVYITL